VRAYAQRFVAVLLPAFFPKNPLFVAKLAVIAAQHRDLVEAVAKHDILGLVPECLAARELELVAQIMLRIPFGRDALNARKALAEILVAEFMAAAELGDKSALALALVPFALHRAWVPARYAVQGIGKLLDDDDATHATRGLTLAVAVAQTREVARMFVEAQTVETIGRFFESQAPACFLYLAGRMLVAIAPFLRLDGVGDAAVRDTVAAAVKMAFTHPNEPRVALVVAQALAILPRGERWDNLLTECDLPRFVQFAQTQFTGQPTVVEITKLLDHRCRSAA
jgi:hypothetical protein